VRNWGTLAGSLAHADPAADYGPAALAFEARLQVQGPSGERTLAAKDLFAGLLQTSLAADEIITSVRFPAADGVASAYEKFAQPASGFAIVGIMAVIGKDAEGNCRAARVAATGIGDRPRRLSSLEAALAGGALDEATVAEACQQADNDLEQVREDLYAQADYRRHLIREFCRRAIRRAAAS
ncbi:MAG: FAD binding domain-containing protein, partial [Acidobacteriota bacterium]